jgi:hypothetical protein
MLGIPVVHGFGLHPKLRPHRRYLFKRFATNSAANLLEPASNLPASAPRRPLGTSHR